LRYFDLRVTDIEVSFSRQPGHYIFEGLIVSQYDNDNTPIVATFGSPFYIFVKCDEQFAQGATECIGTAEQWVYASFAGIFISEHLPWNIFYLIGVIIVSRGITAIALANLNYRST
jgi:predicted branched-subunit amino acid permease